MLREDLAAQVARQRLGIVAQVDIESKI